MSDFKERLHDLLARRSDEIVRRITRAYEQPTDQPRWSPDEVEQYVRAALTLYQEGLDGGRENRDYFLSAVLPGLVQRGIGLEEMVSGGYRTHLMLHAVCADLLADDDTRGPALEWLAEFAVSWMTEVFRRTHELEAKTRRLA